MILKNNICIIPAKGNSERLPGKNIKLLASKPLIAYTIEAAKRSDFFDDIVVSTESDEIAEVSSRYGARIPYKRPLELTQNSVGLAKVYIDILNYIKEKESISFKNTFIFLPTSPFRRTEFIKEAYELFCSNPKAKVLMSVKESEYPPFWALVQNSGKYYKRLFHDGEANMVRHNLPKAYQPDGNIMILRTGDFIKRGNYNFPQILIYKTPEYFSHDIDNPIDFEFAEYLIQNKKIL